MLYSTIKRTCYYLMAALIICFWANIDVYGQFNNFSIQQKGFVELDHISYFTQEEDKINTRNQGIFQMEFNSDYDKDFSWYAAVEIREDIADPSRNRVYLDEYYIRFPVSISSFKIGKQIYTWGQGDLIKPTNNLNPIDYSDFLDTEDETMGVLSVSLCVPYKRWMFEGVIIPLFTPNKLPETNSRWYTKLPDLMPNPLNPHELLHTQYTFISPDLPSDDWRSLQLAGRISGTIKNFDVAMSYYYGYNKFPFFDKSLHHLSQDTMYLNIQKRYSRIQSVGGDFATVVADFGMHGEIAYYITEDIDDGALADGPFLRSL